MSAFDGWQQVSPYLDQALSLSEGDRVAWLRSLHIKDPKLASLLETLLGEHDELAKRHFLESTPVAELNIASSAGQTIGPYILVTPIGHGGMGSVWLAERHDG